MENMTTPQLYAQNKKAFHEYEILEKMEAGIKLDGGEVKAVKLGHVNLTGAYVTLKNGEAYLLNASISAYQPGNAPKNYDPAHSRKLLLHKKELAALIGTTKQKGLTIVPLCVYNKNNLIKVEIGIARGKRQYEKRETLKKRVAQREIGRAHK